MSGKLQSRKSGKRITARTSSHGLLIKNKRKNMMNKTILNPTEGPFPGVTRSYKESKRVTRSHKESQGAKESHKESKRATNIVSGTVQH